jgi:threonyl-tRNA synthetase
LRFLSFHVDSFKYKVSQRGRSKIVDEITDQNKERTVENAIVLFISTEKRDEAATGVISRTVVEVDKIAKQLDVHAIVINPFAHLFGELSSLEFASTALKQVGAELLNLGYVVVQIPFGWFNELEMRAKGHPLSRIGRIIE